MRHAREDYNRIQDPSGKIPDNEPVFILRGQDKYASQAVRFYAALAEDNKVDPKLVSACRDMADWMDAWEKHKEPDLVN